MLLRQAGSPPHSRRYSPQFRKPQTYFSCASDEARNSWYTPTSRSKSVCRPTGPDPLVPPSPPISCGPEPVDIVSVSASAAHGPVGGGVPACPLTSALIGCWGPALATGFDPSPPLSLSLPPSLPSLPDLRRPQLWLEPFFGVSPSLPAPPSLRLPPLSPTDSSLSPFSASYG